MDVIGPDVCSSEKEASGRLTNGNATSEDKSMTAAACGAGRRKKAKRKNKAKNSQIEPDVGIANVTTTTVGTAPVTPLKAVPAEKGTAVHDATTVNSNIINSNSHNSHHSYELLDDALTTIVAISKKLEQCVHIGLNGMTNGLPKHEEDNAPDAGDRSNSAEGPGAEAQRAEKVPASRKKQRNRQAKKAQANAHCTVNGNEEDERDPPKSTAFPEPTHDRSAQPLEATKTTVSRTEEGIGATAGVQGGSADVGSAKATSSTTSSVPLPAPVGEDSATSTPVQITYQVYESERQMPAIMALIQKDLSEPYSIYTYRYFIHNWPKLCFLALHQDTCVGAIVCKLDIHRQETRRGYIAMLAVDKDYRKLKIGTTLVQKAIQVMLEDNADEVVLETEITNQPALRLYENLGFVRDKRLFHYYLNGVDALRLKLWFR